MEEKSNDDKAKSEAENKNTGGWFLNRLPDACADYILKYLDKESLWRLLLVHTQKDPVTKKLHYDKITNLPVYEQLKRRSEYFKYFMWYVYGFGNAERLCKIVDEIVNKRKNEIGDDKNKKFLLWHMIVLDILNIKISDLKLDFEKEKSESVGEAIKNCLLTTEAVNRRNDFINGFINQNKNTSKIENKDFASELYKYSKKIFPEFAQIKYLNNSRNDPNTQETEYKFLSKVFSCFLKVSFYHVKKVADFEEYKSDSERYQERIDELTRYFYIGNIYDGRINASTEYMATYLYKTGELDQWLLNYGNDFFDFFCYCGGDSHFNGPCFDEFCFYLNKIKPLETRYREDDTGCHKKFWQMFFPQIYQDYWDNKQHLSCIRTYFSDEKLINSAKNELEKMLNSKCSDLFTPSDQDKQIISDDNQKNYFGHIITRLCGKKDLTDKAIQSISEVIENKNVLNNNLAISNQIDLISKDKISDPNNKLNGKNKVGFWQHFLFGLFFVLTCFSLFLCFEFSPGFLVLFLISLIICSCLGFKNYCSCCRCSKNIKIPFGNNSKYIPIESQSMDNNLIKVEKTVEEK